MKKNQSPKEYVDLLDEFVQTNLKGVKIGGANREDFVALRVAAYCLDLPVEVRMKNGTIFLIRIPGSEE